MIEFPEFSKRGWLRLGFFVVVSCVAQLLSSYAMAHLVNRAGYQNTFGYTIASAMISVLPLIAVLIWKGEFSFFDLLKHEGRIQGWRLWVIPGIPAIVSGIVSLVEYPQGLTFFYNQLKTQGLDLFAFSSLGLGILSALCVSPTIVKWLGDNADWKWFLGLSAAVSFLPTLVELLYRWLLMGNPGKEYLMFSPVSAASILVPLYGAAISAVVYLLVMLWSKGDMRAAIAASMWTALCRFFAPTHANVAGVVSGLVGLFLLWLAVGGMRQLQRSRAMVARAETREV